VPARTLLDLLIGKATLSSELAERIEAVLGMSKETPLRMQARWDEVRQVGLPRRELLTVRPGKGRAIGPAHERVTLRLDRMVPDHFRAGGSGWQIRPHRRRCAMPSG
jgi:uncharacterized protein (DUF4415 family)